MRTIHLPIQDPCHEDWDAMAVEDRRRFCDVCQKHVHDLSAMAEDDARALLADGRRGGERLCVRYAHDDDGNILFRRRECSPPPRPLGGTLRAAAASVLLAACTPHDTPDEHLVVGTLAPPPIETIEMGEVAVIPDEPCDPPRPEVKGEAPPHVVGQVPAPKPEPEITMGSVAPEAKVLKGRVKLPEPTHELMGDVAAPDERP